MGNLTGSSPRLRGTDFCHALFCTALRFIPAPAGNRLPPAPPPARPSVHPRACGEQAAVSKIAAGISGSSPRLRGTVPAGTGRPGSHRFIPAPAGNRPAIFRGRFLEAVHPRACGEQRPWCEVFPGVVGSSPRLRGTGCRLSAFANFGRFIPAPAGNSRPGRRSQARATVHPRACGEQLYFIPSSRIATGSSPRLRGTGGMGEFLSSLTRFIPAPAGNSPRSSGRLQRPPVHPRACGEQSICVFSH